MITTFQERITIKLAISTKTIFRCQACPVPVSLLQLAVHVPKIEGYELADLGSELRILILTCKNPKISVLTESVSGKESEIQTFRPNMMTRIKDLLSVSALSNSIN